MRLYKTANQTINPPQLQFTAMPITRSGIGEDVISAGHWLEKLLSKPLMPCPVCQEWPMLQFSVFCENGHPLCFACARQILSSDSIQPRCPVCRVEAPPNGGHLGHEPLFSVMGGSKWIERATRFVGRLLRSVYPDIERQRQALLHGTQVESPA